MNVIDSAAIVSILGAVASAVAAFAAYRLGIRKMYVDVVVKERLASVNERRYCLKQLYYYTNPDTIKRIRKTARVKYIRKLLETQSILESRLLECLYPESKLLDSCERLVKSAIKYVESGKMPPRYIEERRKCLQLLKIYNFASWQYGQAHANGKLGDSIVGFDKSFVKTLRSFERNTENRALIKVNLDKTI